MSNAWIDDLISDDKVEGILSWAKEEGGEFDTEFVEELGDRLESGADLSMGQEQALDNIIKQWRIPEDYF